MHGEMCVVTGATNGIGRATAIGLAKVGAQVVIVARNQSKAAEVVAEISQIPGAPTPEIVLADLTEMKQVCRACDEIRTRFDHVDVLINNAAGLFDTYHESSEGIEDAYAVNHLAVFLLTLALHPSLQKAPHPRVVIVSSNVHEKAVYIRDYLSLVKPKYAWSQVYAQTKLRTMIFTRALSERWKNDGIRVNSVHPGMVDTGLMGGWDNRMMKAVFKVAQLFFLSPEKGARTSIFLASDPSVGMVTGTYFAKCKPHPYNPIADDVPIQKLLWDESMTFLKKAGIDGV
jgi:NAD(P)-dependent dehydrogenase (short-subunit alcohol dehydrogenase family)